MRIVQEPLILFLQKIIHFAVRTLAILMTLVILWGVADVILMIIQRLWAPPVMFLSINDILAYKHIEPDYIFATAAVVLALSIGYWLIEVKGKDGEMKISGESPEKG